MSTHEFPVQLLFIGQYPTVGWFSKLPLLTPTNPVSSHQGRPLYWLGWSRKWEICLFQFNKLLSDTSLPHLKGWAGFYWISPPLCLQEVKKEPFHDFHDCPELRLLNRCVSGPGSATRLPTMRNRFQNPKTEKISVGRSHLQSLDLSDLFVIQGGAGWNMQTRAKSPPTKALYHFLWNIQKRHSIILCYILLFLFIFWNLVFLSTRLYSV